MQTFGKKGEDIAFNFLEENQYQIIQRNYRFKKSEIDIICQKAGLLIFVEVKTRSSKAFGYPEQFVSISQQKAIIRAAEHYVEETKWAGDIRFDIIAIVMKAEMVEIEHLKDAFY